MEATSFVAKIAQFMNQEKSVYVVAYERDENGYVIGKREYPVSMVFGHCDGYVEIICEEADVKITTE